jgi:hypothetical protein
VATGKPDEPALREGAESGVFFASFLWAIAGVTAGEKCRVVLTAFLGNPPPCKKQYGHYIFAA